MQTEKFPFYEKNTLFRVRTVVHSHAQLTFHVMIHNLKKKKKKRVCLLIMDSLGSLSYCQQAQEKFLWLHVLATLSVDGRTEMSFNRIQVKGDLCSVF